MSNYTYMVTNKINGKVYVGSHSWKGEGLDPNYFGSGKIIKQAIEKYGKNNFQVEVLYFYSTVEECRQDEERILTEYNVKDCPHSYNCKNSAIGFTSEDMKGEKHPWYGRHHTEEAKRKMSESKKGENNPNYGKHLSEETRKKLSQARTGENNHMYGKHHTEETRQKMSQALKGENNPWYGKPLSEEHRKKLAQSKKNVMTPIVAIDKNCKVKIFESQHECSRVLNLDRKNIYDCLKGRKKTCKGYFIKHLKRCSKYYKITKRKAKETEKIKLTTKRLTTKRKGTTPIVAIPKNAGRVRLFLSKAECCRVLGIDSGNVSKCLKGRLKSTGGYTFKKINRDKRVYTVSQRSKADLNRLRGIAE